MMKSACCSKEGLNRGAWTALEDKILTNYIKVHGEGKWRSLPKKAGLKRCGKSCRLRWLNYLRPDIKRGNITPDEEDLIIRLHRLLGNRWSLIAARLPGRTDNEIKNYWNTSLGKKVKAGSNSTLTPNNSNQSKQMKKKLIGSPPATEKESSIVRTKAVRCTKVYLRAQEDQIEHINSVDFATTVAPTVGGDDHHMTHRTLEVVEPEFYNGLASFVSAEDNSSPNFMADLNEEELRLSDLLGCDFSQLCGFDYGMVGEGSNGGDNDVFPSSSSGQRHCIPKEMLELENWTRSDGVQPAIVSDIQSLASLILDSEEDW
uniref:Transcription factor TT2-like n=1 Tax=Nelumbo nucifera TaxID=4432 RepID=A0A822XQI9_NELNU|nr:TPA_asm: hypothetical protein HUJ06_025337 [Nelumbo nucifera]